MTILLSTSFLMLTVRVFTNYSLNGNHFTAVSKGSLTVLLLFVFYADVCGFQIEDTGSITGSLKTRSGDPIPFATVRLLSAIDSTLVKGAVADSAGRFDFQGVRFGKYIIGLTSISSKTFFSTVIDLKADNRMISIGEILIEEKILTMQEVVVSASKPMIEIRGDKMIVNIGSSFLAAGNTMGEVLQNLPGVTKTARGMELNGKPVLILVDGKGQYNTRSVTELLTTLGADKVENVEIISNPSSKYDANIQGIINIKLKKDNSISTARINYGQPLYPDAKTPGFKYYRINPGVTLNYKAGIFTTTTSLDFTNRNSYEASDDHTDIEDEFKVSNYVNRTESEKYFNFRSDIQLKPKKSLNSVYGITVSGFYNFENKGIRASVNDYFNYPGLEFDSTFVGRSVNKSKGVNLLNATLYHSKKFEKFKQEIDVIYDFYNRNSDIDYSHSSTLFDNQMEELVANEIITSTSLDQMHGHAINVNYLIRPSSAIGIEAGLKTTLLRVKRQLTYDASGDEITSGALFDSDFKYDENIYAAYTSFSYAFQTVSIDFGTRAEYVDGDGKFFEQPVSIDYFQAYPYANVNFTKIKNLALEVSYARKISRRPNFTELNPAIEYRTPFTLLEGNPSLKPTFTNQFNIQTVFFSKYSASLYYDLDENIRAIAPVENEENNFVFQTINVRGSKRLGISLTAPVEITKKWTVNFNVSGTHVIVKSSDFDLFTSAYYANIFFNSDYRISPNINLQVSLSYDSPYRNGFNYYGEMVGNMIGFNFFAFKRVLSINLRVSDPLGVTKFKFGSDYEGFEQYTKAATNQRSINLRLQYNFKTGRKFTSKAKQAKNFGDIRFN
jgi:hypothetical protein